MKKVRIKITQDDDVVSKEFGEYRSFAVDEKDPILAQMIQEAKDVYKGEFQNPDIRIKIDYTL